MGISYFCESDIDLLRPKMADEGDDWNDRVFAAGMWSHSYVRRIYRYGDFFKGRICPEGHGRPCHKPRRQIHSVKRNSSERGTVPEVSGEYNAHAVQGKSDRGSQWTWWRLETQKSP